VEEALINFDTIKLLETSSLCTPAQILTQASASSDLGPISQSGEKLSFLQAQVVSQQMSISELETQKQRVLAVLNIVK